MMVSSLWLLHCRPRWRHEETEARSALLAICVFVGVGVGVCVCVCVCGGGGGGGGYSSSTSGPVMQVFNYFFVISLNKHFELTIERPELS